MYCKLKRWYEKNGAKSTKKSKSDSGKTKSTVTRIVKQIDHDEELADMKEKEVFDYCGKLKMPSKNTLPDSQMSNYSELKAL
jgi:hypothetical protein